MDLTHACTHADSADRSMPRPRRRGSLARLGWISVRTPYVLLMAPTAAIGGQAVMEGVMMRGPHTWAVAVRRYDGTIAEVHRELVSFGSRHRWARFPLVRGVVALFEALVIGMKALFVSSEYAIDDVEAKVADKEAARDVADPGPAEEAVARRVHEVAAGSTASGEAPVDTDGAPDPDGLGTWAIVGAMIVAVAFSVLLFKVVPVTLTTFLPLHHGSWAFVLVEVAIKFSIFIAYLLLVGLMPDMRRVFQYHSAEHKAINAWEHGIELTPAKVNGMSRIHVRCGTAFIVWLFIVGLLVFRLFSYLWEQGVGSELTRLEIVGSRPLLLPIVAGLSFEILRFAGRHADNGLLRGVLAPGLWFQRLTTRECDDEQCEVAVRSLELVLEAEAARSGSIDAAAGADDAKDDAYRVLA
jgi:uncharacterized protein YqhQ